MMNFDNIYLQRKDFNSNHPISCKFDLGFVPFEKKKTKKLTHILIRVTKGRISNKFTIKIIYPYNYIVGAMFVFK